MWCSIKKPSRKAAKMQRRKVRNRISPPVALASLEYNTAASFQDISPGRKTQMRPLLSFVLLTLVLAVSPAAAQKRSITEKDLFNFVWIADPQISPDGAAVAFVKVTVNEKKDGYNTAI